MIERTPKGLEITDRRTSGETFSTALLASNYPIPASVKANILEEGELFFGRFDIVIMSEDRQHAIGTGVDEHRRVLIRDGKPLFQISQGYFSILAGSDDFSALVVRHNEKGARKQGSIYLIKDGEPRRLISGDHANLLWQADDFKSFWVSSSEGFPPKRQTYLSHLVLQEDGRFKSEKRFFIGRELEEPILVGVSEGGSDILYKGYQGYRDFVYRNNTLVLFGQRVAINANADISRVLYAVWERGGIGLHYTTEIFLGGKDGKAKRLYGSNNLKVGEIERSKDIDRAMIKLVGANVDHNAILFLVGEQFYLSRPFEKLTGWRIEDDGRMIAEVVRDKNDRVITVPAAVSESGGGEPLEAQDIPAA